MSLWHKEFELLLQGVLKSDLWVLAGCTGREGLWQKVRQEGGGAAIMLVPLRGAGPGPELCESLQKMASELASCETLTSRSNSR